VLKIGFRAQFQKPPTSELPEKGTPEPFAILESRTAPRCFTVWRMRQIGHSEMTRTGPEALDLNF
jgi:hypothetical protein